jgi:hypothetical protein
VSAQSNSQNSNQLAERQDGDDTNNPQKAGGTVITGSGRAREGGDPSADCDTRQHLTASLYLADSVTIHLEYRAVYCWNGRPVARVRPGRGGSPARASGLASGLVLAARPAKRLSAARQQ